MIRLQSLLLLTSALILHTSTAFVTIPHKAAATKSSNPRNPSRRSPLIADTSSSSPSSSSLTMMMNLRGGAELLSTVVSNLQTPNLLAVGTLWGVCSSIVVPLTLYRRTWSISVGYGLSVFGMATTLFYSHYMKEAGVAVTELLPWKQQQDPALLLVTCAMFYGLRLGTYLLVRQVTSKRIRNVMKEGDSKENKMNFVVSRLKRIPLALGVSLFYTFMTTPCLYALGVPASSSSESLLQKVAYAGAGIAWLGAILEAVADTHKFMAKWKVRDKDDSSSDDDKKFVGPTGGVFGIVRHPSYLGEITFWTGLFVGGLPSFQKNVTAWVCSSLGLYGILKLMTGAASRLDKKQSENYGGQPKYEEWKKNTKSSIIPFVQ